MAHIIAACRSRLQWTLLHYTPQPRRTPSNTETLLAISLKYPRKNPTADELGLERAESVSPTLVSIVPPIQAVIDAGMVADAGGEKSASRSG
jgi:hypothetical protein